MGAAKRFVGGIALAAGGLCLALGLCELLARAVVSDTQRPVADSRPKFYYAAGGTKSFKNYSFLRDKAQGQYRIAIFGDSFTYPHVMQFDYAFPKVLERMLNLDAEKRGSRVEVINYGKPGLSAFSELRDLADVLADNPDMLILEITLNDAANDITSRDISRRMGRECSFDLPEISQAKTPVLYYSKLAALLYSRWHNRATHSCYIKYHRSLYEAPGNWQRFIDSYRQIRALAADKGVPVFTMLFPLLAFPLDGTYPMADIHTKICLSLEKEGIPCLDLLPAFRNIPHQSLQVIVDKDSHPNEIAHRLAAERLYIWLEHHTYLPPEYRIQRKFVRRVQPSPWEGTGVTSLQSAATHSARKLISLQAHKLHKPRRKR